MKMTLNTKKLVGEDERMCVYITRATEDMEHMLHDYSPRGLSLMGWKVFLVEHKDDGERRYVAFDERDVPRFDAGDIYEFDLMMRLKLMELEDSLDLRNIAETGEVPQMR